MLTQRYTLVYILLMTSVVVASNILVQYPVQGMLGAINLADVLTWGAFTYPFAFLVTDLANRRYGPRAARGIVFVGFVLAVACSMVLPPLLYGARLIAFETTADRLVRIALASGAAFLTAQLLDVGVFNRLRRRSWWRAPVFGSLAGSVVDTAIFFSAAFAPAFAALGPNDAFALEPAPLAGFLPLETARWVSWAIGDLGVKLGIAVVALIPYRLIAARWAQPVLA
jgi:uncharacterized integral membrane protein (TIGR00697 family)